MRAFPVSRYLFMSVICHSVILFIFMLGFEFSSQLPVISNTNQQDTISAVVLGDIAKSHIVPTPIASTPVPSKKIVETKKELPPTEVETVQDKEKAIALTVKQQKKLAEEKQQKIKKMAEKKQQELFAKDLLADIKKQQHQHQQLKQQQVKSQFEKILQQQTEQSLRQQLLNEEIKLQGRETRLSQGELNKYKALILQSISEHWIVPPQANKSLYCELMIRVAPDGTVLEVHVTKTSGDPALDSSARAAVLKSSPLPVPTDPVKFAAFRQFALKVKPENVIGYEGTN